jgi:hypothetical protein
MGFNKIKSLSTDKNIFFEALKDSDFVEFNADQTKIRKKNLKKEFL